MKATKLPSGAWRCQVYLGKSPDGKRQYASITRPNKHDCVIEAERLAKYHHETERDPSNLTLGEAADKYIQMKSNVLSQSTIRGYNTIKSNHFLPEQQIPINKISKNIFQQAINREALTCSPKTIRNVNGFFSTVIAQFSDRVIKATLPQPISKNINLLSEQDLKRLIQLLDGEEVEIPILLAMFLGLRRSEILALTHDDFDQTTNILNINKALVPDKDNQYVLKTTKTVKSTRQISVPPYLAEKLKSRIRDGKPLCSVSPSHICTKLGKICEKHGLPKIRLHDLRHQNASIMLKLGVADKYAMERGGWSSNTTMKNIYQHTMSNERVSVDKAIDSYFEGLTK